MATPSTCHNQIKVFTAFLIFTVIILNHYITCTFLICCVKITLDMPWLVLSYDFFFNLMSSFFQLLNSSRKKKCLQVFYMYMQLRHRGHTKLTRVLLLFVALKSRIAPTAKSLAAGTRQTRPAHIPAHLPPLPDPHSYIKTPVSHLFMDWKFVKEALFTCERHSGLMVSVLIYGSSSPGLSLGHGHCFVFLGNTLKGRSSLVTQA